MQYDSGISGFVREATQDFLSQCLTEQDMSKNYDILYDIKIFPLGNVICLDMTLLEKNDRGYRNPRKQRAIQIDQNILN